MSDMDPEKLIGRWGIDVTDTEAFERYGLCVLEFDPDGRLRYTVIADGEANIMSLTWRLEGAVLVTDQPSHPREERTHVSFTADGKFCLRHDDHDARYIRMDAGEE